MSTRRYNNALALAATAHEGQLRKGTQVPYITHPVAVAELVARMGGSEDQQIAALLHDVIEDGGAGYRVVIDVQFGPAVLRLVDGLTDGVADSSGRKEPWRQRKEHYLAELRLAPEDVLLVSACDKYSNALAIVQDLEDIGASVFTRFTGKREGTLWYYNALLEIFNDRRSPLAAKLHTAISRMNFLAR